MPRLEEIVDGIREKREERGFKYESKEMLPERMRMQGGTTITTIIIMIVNAILLEHTHTHTQSDGEEVRQRKDARALLLRRIKSFGKSVRKKKRRRNIHFILSLAMYQQHFSKIHTTFS